MIINIIFSIVFIVVCYADSASVIINPIQIERDSLKNVINDITVENKKQNNSLSDIIKEKDSQIGKIKNELQDIKKNKSNAKQKAKDDNYEKYSNNQKNTDRKILLLILILSISVLILGTSAFYLYRWRRLISSKDGREFIKPEDYNKLMSTFSYTLETNIKKINILDKNVIDQANYQKEKITNMTDTFMSMQQKLDKQDAEITRLKKGYDSEIYRKFLMRFIRVNQIISDNMKSEELNMKLLERLKLRLDDALEECNVESFIPRAGDHCDNYNLDDLEIIRESTQETNNNGIIFKVIEEGYKLTTTGNEYHILIPAKVKVYDNTEEG